MSKSGSVWGVINAEARGSKEMYVKLKVGVGYDLLFTLLIALVLFILFSPRLRGHIVGIVFLLIIAGAFTSAALLSITWMKQKLIEDVQKAFDIPAVVDR